MRLQILCQFSLMCIDFQSEHKKNREECRCQEKLENERATTLSVAGKRHMMFNM
jgi:hypothetical protein